MASPDGTLLARRDYDRPRPDGDRPRRDADRPRYDDRPRRTTARGAMIVRGGGNRPREDRPPPRDGPRTATGRRETGQLETVRPATATPRSAVREDRPRRDSATPHAAAAWTPARRSRRWSAATRTTARGGPRPDGRRDWQPRDNRPGRPYATAHLRSVDAVDTCGAARRGRGASCRSSPCRRGVRRAPRRRPLVGRPGAPRRSRPAGHPRHDIAHPRRRAGRWIAHGTCRFRRPPGNCARGQAAATR